MGHREFQLIPCSRSTHEPREVLIIAALLRLVKDRVPTEIPTASGSLGDGIPVDASSTGSPTVTGAPGLRVEARRNHGSIAALLQLVEENPTGVLSPQARALLFSAQPWVLSLARHLASGSSSDLTGASLEATEWVYDAGSGYDDGLYFADCYQPPSPVWGDEDKAGEAFGEPISIDAFKLAMNVEGLSLHEFLAQRGKEAKLSHAMSALNVDAHHQVKELSPQAVEALHQILC